MLCCWLDDVDLPPDVKAESRSVGLWHHDLGCWLPVEHVAVYVAADENHLHVSLNIHDEQTNELLRLLRLPCIGMHALVRAVTLPHTVDTDCNLCVILCSTALNCTRDLQSCT